MPIDQLIIGVKQNKPADLPIEQATADMLFGAPEVNEIVTKTRALISANNEQEVALEQTAIVAQTAQSGLANKVDKVAGKGLSTQDYTTAEKTKLAGLEGSHYKGRYLTPTALQAAHPTGAAGDYARVDAGAGADVETYIWDDSDGEWVREQGTGTTETAASIKTKYESNPDTNVFSDAEKQKLDNAVEIDTLADNLPPVNFPQFGEPTLVNGVKTYVSQDIIDAQTRADEAYALAASAPTGTGTPPNPKEFYFRWSGATNEGGVSMLSGTGTAVLPMENNNLGFPYVTEINTGTTATGAAAAMHKSSNTSITSNRGGIQASLVHTFEMEQYIRFAGFTSAADATDAVVFNMGFQNASGSANADAANGLWAKLTHNALQLTSRASSTYTAAPESTVLDVETWYKVKVVYVVGVSLKLYINDALVSTITTGLPANTNYLFPVLHYFKTAGAASKVMRWGMGYYKFTLV